MKATSKWIEVLDDQGRIIQELDENDNCHPYEPNDRCGGCGECMLMQASYHGYTLRPKNT